MQANGIIHRDIKNANIFLSIPTNTPIDKNYIIPFFDSLSTHKNVNIIQHMLNTGTEENNYNGLTVKLGDFGFSTILERG